MFNNITKGTVIKTLLSVLAIALVGWFIYTSIFPEFEIDGVKYSFKDEDKFYGKFIFFNATPEIPSKEFTDIQEFPDISYSDAHYSRNGKDFLKYSDISFESAMKVFTPNVNVDLANGKCDQLSASHTDSVDIILSGIDSDDNKYRLKTIIQLLPLSNKNNYLVINSVGLMTNHQTSYLSSNLYVAKVVKSSIIECNLQKALTLGTENLYNTLFKLPENIKTSARRGDLGYRSYLRPTSYQVKTLYESFAKYFAEKNIKLKPFGDINIQDKFSVIN